MYILCYIWDKVFRNEPSKICGRQPLKYLKGYGLLRQTISLQMFTGCLPQILLGQFFKTLSRIPSSPAFERLKNNGLFEKEVQ